MVSSYVLTLCCVEGDYHETQTSAPGSEDDYGHPSLGVLTHPLPASVEGEDWVAPPYTYRVCGGVFYFQRYRICVGSVIDKGAPTPVI